MLSSNNNERDDKHRKLWTEAMERVRAVIDDPKYKEINLIFDACDPDE